MNNLVGSASIKIGDEVSESVLFDEQSIRTYATMAGDLNPLHHDAAAAAASRFGKLIASATQTSGVMLGILCKFIFEHHSSLGLEFSFQLKRAVYVDEPYRVGWRLVERAPNAKLKGDLALFNGEMTDSTGAVVITGSNRVVLFPLGTLP